MFSIGTEAEVIIDRLIADQGDDKNAITTRNITPAQYPQITGAVADRAVNFAVAVQQLPAAELQPGDQPEGAPGAGRGHRPGGLQRGARWRQGRRSRRSRSSTRARRATVANPDFSADGKPDIEAAKQLLQDSGETLPYPIKLTYPIGSDATDKAFAALKASYDQAGFQVTLDGLDPSGPYYDTIQKPGSDSDLIWGGWGADWPSISTVIPPLFDSRINISKASNGQDYGNYQSDAVNAAIDAAGQQTDLDKANSSGPTSTTMLADGRCLHPAGRHAVLLPARLQHRELRQLLRHQRVRRPRLHRSQEQLTQVRVPPQLKM